MKKTLHFVHKEHADGSSGGRKVYVPVDMECCVDREYFWALPLTEDTARVLNMPVFTHEFGLGALVRVSEDGEIVEVLERGPRTRVARYPLSHSPRRTRRRWHTAREYLERHDARCESITPGRFAMAVPEDMTDERLEEICNECEVRVRLVPPDDHTRAVLGETEPRCACCGRPANACARG